MKPQNIYELKELTPEDLHKRLVDIDKQIHKLRQEAQQIRVIIKKLKN